MKKLLLVAGFLLIGFATQAQAFEGKYDQKLSIGASLQEHGTGIAVIYDYGLGQNISVGLASSYILDVEEPIDANFGDRFDLKARFNANLSDVIGVSDAFDLYPGLDVSLKNFGGHVGTRYFFTDGFGLFAEVGFPLAKYNTDDLTVQEKLFNQPVFNVGASFSL
ncbi:DUF6646 family protein [Pustulibacterium marinum]|nr:DUF6646 family protein [Pustulibacterium marinum]